jgi:hypothetical protein
VGKQQETNVWRSVQLALSPRGYRLFRNQRYKGPIVSGGKITSAWADCGLCDGAADLIGFRIVTVTPEMLNKRIAIFCAVETKVKGGDRRDEQIAFIRAVQEAGGIAGFAESEGEALKLFL